MRVTLSVPAANERGPLYMEQVLLAWHQGNPGRCPLDLEFLQHAGSVALACSFPPELRGVVEGNLYAHYPDCRLDPFPNISPSLGPDQTVWTAGLRLCPDVYPCKRYGQFEDALNRNLADPITAILTALSAPSPEPLRSRILLTIRPASAQRHHRAERCVRRLASPFFRSHHRLSRLYLRLALSRWGWSRVLGWLLGQLGRGHHSGPAHTALHTSTARLHEREDDLQAASDKVGRPLFEAQFRLYVAGSAERAGQAQRKVRQLAAAFGQFSLSRLASFQASSIRRGFSGSDSATFLISAEELATLWHLPTLTVGAPTLLRVASRELEPPVTLPTPRTSPDLAVLGVTAFRGRQQRFGLLPEDRLRHVAIVGKTGMGKSTLLHHLVASDIVAGRGVALIDPHGDLCEAVLRSVPRSRTNEVVLFDAADVAYPVAFNPLNCPNPADRPLAASGILSTFKKLYGDFWGPRLEHILRNCLLALLEVPDTSLLSVLRLLGESKYRQSIVSRISDPVVRGFWEHEFAGLPERLRAEAIAPIQNKVGQFVSSPLLRNIIGQARSRLDLRKVMDTGQVLLVNLSKGRMGEDSSSLLGSFLVTGLQLAAMGRAEMPEEERRDFYLYVDEFQNLATDSFGTILSEARKYRLGLTLANQYLAQVEESTLAAVFGNVGTLVVFQVGAQDTDILTEQLGGDLQTQDLVNLPRYRAYARLLLDGQPTRPFSMQTLPPTKARHDPQRAVSVRHSSQQRYGRPAALVQEGIRRACAGKGS